MIDRVHSAGDNGRSLQIDVAYPSETLPDCRVREPVRLHHRLAAGSKGPHIGRPGPGAWWDVFEQLSRNPWTMSDSAEEITTTRVRPVSGVVSLMVGIALGVLYIKGYTFLRPGALWMRLSHLTLASGSFLWGIKSILMGRQRHQNSLWLTRLMPYRIEVTREGWLYFIIMVTVLVGALLGKHNMLLLVFGLLAGPFVLNGHIALTMLTRNQVVRNLPPRVMQGEWFAVDVTLSNRRWAIGSWMLVIEDHWQHGTENLFPIVVFTRVGPSQERTSRYQLRLMPRGRHVCGPVRLLTRFPLGLVERSYVMSCPGELLVYPRIGRLTSQWHREQMNADELVQHTRPRSGAFEDEFHRLREYRQGDSLRSIHWRTTARRNQLMVRENHQMRDLDLALVLDLWLPASPTAAELANVELALSFMATVTVEHCQKSRESTLFIGIAGQHARWWCGAAGPQTMPQLLDEFAMAEGTSNGTLGEVVEACFRMRSSHVNRILITTRDERQPSVKMLLDVQADSQHRGMPMRLVVATPEELQRFFDNSEDTGPAHKTLPALITS